MHRCGSSHGNMVGPCTCGLFNSQSNAFSMPNHKPFDEADMYSAFISSSSSVDCTLSLGPPSSGLSSDSTEKRVHHDRRSSSNSMSNFSNWDILQSKQIPSPPTASKTSSGSHSNNNNSGGETLIARRCANCDATSTPLWRNGPRGPKSLCNACGIRFKKEERRATAAAAGGAASGVMEPQHMINNSWVQQSQSQKLACHSPAIGNEFRFIEDDDRDADSGIPFLSWRLSVADMPSLVHDFTR